ncbi:hypothetical protein EVAR_101365_1 [Eumeta japonica]|uniref:Uncharacterized protein n=1 Tax=Eumeta variegata TaxID=151549 RepID=A0A4C1SJD2_EUMVA|nr:hypothetical protein EVAR_101365_1 [Eumeta japonica]
MQAQIPSSLILSDIAVDHDPSRVFGHIAHGPIIAGQERFSNGNHELDAVKWVDRPLGGPTTGPSLQVTVTCGGPSCECIENVNAGGYRRVRPTLQRNNDRVRRFSDV